MSAVGKVVSIGKCDGKSPRERIVAAASELFYRHGIRAVGVETIAEAAKTNKMTLYRHFSSKDELVAEYLRQLADKSTSAWARREAEHPGDPLGQVRAWLQETAARVTGALRPFTGETDIFIYPGYRFRVTDGLMTNFHLPQSTLLMLVSALMGRDRIRRIYDHALEGGYRFFSYGDASLLLP